MDEYWKGLPYYQEKWTSYDTVTKLKIIAVLAGVVIVIILTILLVIPNSFLRNWLARFVVWLDEVDIVWRTVLLFIAQLIAVMLCLPGTIFNLACGFSLGFWLGTVVSVVSTDLAALFSFIITRYFAKEWAAEQVAKRPSFAVVDNAIKHSGWYLIFLIRLSPIFPFGLCNYLFGLADVSLPVYWASSTLGLIPYTVAYTYLGSLIGNVADLFGEGSDDTEESSEWIIIVVGVVMTIITIAVIGYVTKREVQKAIQKAEEEEKPRLEDLEGGDVHQVKRDGSRGSQDSNDSDV